jgi:mRNA interferase HigB
VNVISKLGLMDLIKNKSKDVQNEALAWYWIAEKADWRQFADVKKAIPDADPVDSLLVFNIRHNRYRLIVYPVFQRRKLYIKALLTHAEYGRKDWKTKWP